MSAHGAVPVPGHAVLVLVDLAGGGTQKVVSGLAVALLDAGTGVTLVTNQSHDGRWAGPAGRADIVELAGELQMRRGDGFPKAFGNLRWLLRAARTIRAIARTVGPETPILSFLPGTNVLAAMACLGLDVNLVLSERNDITRQRQSTSIRIARRLLYRTAKAVTTNRFDNMTALEQLARGKRVFFVRNPRPPGTTTATPSSSRRIVAVGRLAASKRHHDVIAAFGQVAGAFPDWSLRILGDGPERGNLARQVDALGLSRRVELPGWRATIAEELSEGALLVHAAEHEGAANAILEARAIGLPVIASDASRLSPPLGRAVPEADCTFPVGDIEALAEQLRRLMSDPALRDELGHIGQSFVDTLTAEPLNEWLPVMTRPASSTRTRRH